MSLEVFIRTSEPFAFVHHRHVKRLVVTSLVLLLYTLAQSQPNALLSTGIWARLKIEKNGVYRLDAATLTKAGFDVSSIDPRNFQLYAYPTGMLPQSNSVERPEGLVELAIQVAGEEDGRFDGPDQIFFYGQGPDGIAFDAKRDAISYSNNLYSDQNYYFLTVGEAAGKRISTQQPGDPTLQINEVLDFGYYETDSYNELKSGREWFGEAFDSKLELTVRFPLEGIIPGSPIKLITRLMSQTYSESKFQVFWNSALVHERTMAVVPQTQYGVKGRVVADTLTFPESQVGAASTANQDLRLQYVKGTTGRSVGYLDYLLFQVARRPGWYGNPTLFQTRSAADPFATLVLAQAPANTQVWDVTNPFEVVKAQYVPTSQTLTVVTDQHRFLAAFVANDVPVAVFDRLIDHQSLRTLSTPELLIVTHADFFSEAKRLASHRQTRNGITAEVVTTDQIYNEFSGGRQDVSALRDFTRFLYKKQPGTLRNLLLLGKGSYDYKKRVFNNTNFVPTYESRNSLSPLETYSSDDYFGFLEDSEGEWAEAPAKNHTLDIGVGRLPVKSATEAKDIVDKLISYDQAQNHLGSWKQRILFVADDGDNNTHQKQADELAQNLDGYGAFLADKLYLDAFTQEERPSGQVAPAAASELRKQLDRGFAIVNFTGHGSEQVWMQERILDSSTPALLTNETKLPLFVTATCEFGRNDDPQLISTAELLVKRKNAGAIALVTTTRPVNSGTNFSLNKAFYAALFEPAAQQKELGAIFRKTKNNSQSGVANRNFSLLGDPSLRFGPSPEAIRMLAVSTEGGSDTLRALSKIWIEGEVIREGVRSTDFTGIVEVALYDKPQNLVTKGDENPAFTYKRWAHSLFRGRATVEQGEFALEAILPTGIANEVANGKLVAYGYDVPRMREALGVFENIPVGLREIVASNDTSGPEVELFMGDTTFVAGGITNSDTYLVGMLRDPSGIDISGYGTGNLVAVLDETQTLLMNDYYVASTDDFTSGYFAYPITGLEVGKHIIEFISADNAGNVTSKSITFEVGEPDELVIEALSNYPNPFSASTTIQFAHSRSGEDLEVAIQIFDPLGQTAGSRNFIVENSRYLVDLYEWDGTNTNGIKMNPGIYYVKLSVRSLSDGAKNDKIAKVILLN